MTMETKNGRHAGGRPKGRLNTKTIRRAALAVRLTAATAAGDTTEMAKIERALQALDRKPRPSGPQPGSQAYERLVRAKELRQERIDARTAAAEEKRAAYEATHGTPIAPSAVPPPILSAESEAERRERSRLTPGVNTETETPETETLTPALTAPPAQTPAPDSEADFSARIRRRMQSRTNEGPCDYNNPRAFSVTSLYEKESDIPEPEIPAIERERYSASGFSGRTEQQEREGTWSN
jgi:hypothetical protein